MTNKPVYDPLIRKLWITKDVRFTSDERLRAKSRYSNFSLAMLSLYLIAVSSAEMADILPQTHRPYISLIVLFFSVFILILTLIENSKDYSVKAEKMHSCALEIQALYHQLDLLIKNNKAAYEDKKEILEKYDAILLKYPNHEERAYEIFRARHYDEEGFEHGAIGCIYLKMLISKALLIWYWIADFWLYIFIIFSPVAFLPLHFLLTKSAP